MSSPRAAQPEASGARGPGGRAERIRLLVAALAIAAVWGAAIAFGLARPAPPAVDLRWDALMRGAATPAGTAVARVLAVVGTGVPATVLVLLAAVVVGLRRGWAWAGVVVAASTVSAVDVRVLKAIAARMRPDEAFGTANAFPSGHTTAAVLLAALLVLLFPRAAVRVPAVLYGVGMAWSRTALHAHWLTDVLGGAVLGIGTAVLAVGLARIAMARRVPVVEPPGPPQGRQGRPSLRRPVPRPGGPR